MASVAIECHTPSGSEKYILLISDAITIISFLIKIICMLCLMCNWLMRNCQTVTLAGAKFNLVL